MYKLCKTEQSAARQRELEQGLLAAMSTRRYEEITVSDLCAEMGVPRKSFYRYFSGKDGALHALLDHTILDFEMRHVPVMSRERQSFQEGIGQYFQFWYQQKPLLDALARSGLSGVLIERAIAHAVEGSSMPNRYLAPELLHLRQQATMFGVCGLMSMVVQWHHDGYPHGAGHMSKLATQLMTQPLFTEEASVF